MKAAEKERTKNFNYTDKICDNFVEACRNGTIGFGWVCPNETKYGYCQYRHWIPEDYILFNKEEMDMDLDYETLEEMIEKKREAITEGTPVTEETFKIWKQKRLDAQKAAEEAQIQKAEKDGSWTGRQIFERGLYIKSKEEEAENQGKVSSDEIMKMWKQQQKERKQEELELEKKMAIEAEEAEAKAKAEQEGLAPQ